MKRLVVFYSLSVNTKEAAEKIAERLGAFKFSVCNNKYFLADN